MDSILIGLGALGLAAVLLVVSRRRPQADDGSAAAIRRDMARLVDDLKAAARDQVDRLDREVRRLQEAVAEAERARLALEETHSRARASAPPAVPPARVERPANPLHSRVFELRDAGKDPADIGVETGLEVGEVELILGLRRMPPRA